jgi:FtsP/CotA-like multicopper oxidase with cupredoxin domain
MKLSRRDVIAGAMAIGFPRLVVAQVVDEVVLTAEKSTMPILGKGGSKTPVWRFLKDQPIAVLRAKQGQEFKGRIINHLNQDIWLHWFGVRGPSGQMTINILPGDTNAVDFAFTPPDAGTFWFGPLQHASEQRDMGLYGMLIVEEATPVVPAFNDVPLIFDDWMLDDKGRPQGKFGDLEPAIGEGRLGNWFTVNGAFKSKIKVTLDKPLRLRLLNAANAREMTIIFKGTSPLIMALDGQPITLKPIAEDGLKLLPGQRADLLITEMSPEVAIALDVQDDVTDVVFLQVTGVNISDPVADNFKLPANPLAELGDLATALRIPIEIEGGAKGGLQSAKVGDATLDMRGLLEKGLAWAFNGIAGVGGPPLFEAKKGDTIILEFSNKTSFPQPIHIHGHVWKLTESDGSAVNDSNWTDTAVVPGLATAKLAFVADNVGLWVLQSLIAERSDAGLIAAFSVVAPPELP